MNHKELIIELPNLDGETAFQLIGILDRIVAELWLAYGDEITQADQLDEPNDADPMVEFPF